MTLPASLSVVIPNYNHAFHIGDTIRAHLQQTLPPLEVIVVDDCSTDNSVEVIEAMCAADPRVRLIRRPKNGGPNAALKDGFRQAVGGHIMFASADDIVESTFAEHAVGALIRFPQAAFSFMDPSMFIEDENRMVSVPLALAAGETYFSPDAFEALMQDNYFTIPSNGVVYRRDAIVEIDGFRADFEWQADWAANLILAFRYGAVYVPRSLAHVRMTGGGYSFKGLRDGAGQKRLLYYVLDVLGRDYPDVKPRFRRAGLIPEMRLRDLGWLLTSARHRNYLTPRLFGRLVGREAWFWLRPLAPVGWRRWWRRARA